MTIGKRVHRRATLATWISVLAILLGTLTWLPPAAAETGSPGDTDYASGMFTTSTDDADGDESDPPPGNITTTLEILDPLDTSGDPPALSIDAITIACPAGGSQITGTLTVSDPAEEQIVNLSLLIDSTVVRSIDLHMQDAVTSVPFSIALRNDDAIEETTASVRAVEQDSDEAPVTSDPVTIHVSENGAMLCGAAPNPTPTATATATPDNTPTPTATATPGTPTPTPSPAPTVSYATIINTGGAGLRCRTEPVDGGVITVMPDGARVPVRGEPSNGWVPVTCSGQEGWASGQYLRIDSEPATPPSGDAGRATVVGTGGAGLRCRTAPVSGGIILVAPENSTVPVRGATSNGWVPVTCGGQAGWMSVTYLSLQRGETPGDGDDTTYATVVNTGGLGLRCRTAPENGAIITVMGERSRIPVRGTSSNGWVPVTCAGQSGWASAAYLSLGAAPLPDSDTDEGTGVYGVVVNTGQDSLRCRTQPINGATIVLLPPSTRVETRGDIQNGWVPVICAGQNGWVSKVYFAIEGQPGTTAPPSTGDGSMVMVAGTGGAGLRCRNAPINGGILGVLSEGARVETRGDLQGEWVPVRCFGANGWVSAAYVLFDAGSASVDSRTERIDHIGHL